MGEGLAFADEELYKSFSYLRDEICVTSSHPSVDQSALPAGYRRMTTTVTRLNLMDLPLELRENIYSRVLFCHPPTAYFNPAQGRHQRCQCMQHGLTLVCHSIRYDVLAHFYRTHEVHFILSANTKAALLSWLSNVDPDELALIQRFRIKSKEPCRLGHRPRLVKARIADTRHQTISAHSCCKITRVDMQWRLEEIVELLPKLNGRVVLTKVALRDMFEAVGWFEGCYDLL
jgi:hypothetical protein